MLDPQPKETDLALVAELRPAPPAGAAFVASKMWTATRPENLVVCCSDGRWHAQVEEFVRAQVSERADMYVLPGGAAGFNLWSSSFDEVRVAERAFRFLAERHRLESIWLIAHQDCAYYHARYDPLGDDYIRRRQQEDLERAAAAIVKWCPTLQVHKVYASIERGWVAFTTLPGEWA